MRVYLNRSEKIAVNEFINKVIGEFGDRIQAIFLFGSKVTGDFNQDSDIDMLVVTNQKANRIWKEIVGIAFDIMSEKGHYISVKVIDEAKMRTFYSKGNGFIKSVLAEGQKIWEKK